MWFVLIGVGVAAALLAWKRSQQAEEFPPLPVPATTYHPIAAKVVAKAPTLSRAAAVSAQSNALQNIRDPATLIDLAKQLVAAGYGDLARPLIIKAENTLGRELPFGARM